MRRAPDFLPPRDAAALVGVDIRIFRHLLRKGDIPFSRMPGSGKAVRMCRRADLVAFRKQLERGFAEVR